jgi:hypothetical protein
MLNYLDFMVMLAGLLMYLLTKQKVETVGKIMFWTGLLALLFAEATQFVYHWKG